MEILCDNVCISAGYKGQFTYMIQNPQSKAGQTLQQGQYS